MKKMLALLIVTFLLCCAYAVLAEPLPEARNPISTEILSLFEVSAWRDYEIPRVTGTEEYNAYVRDGDAALIILRKERKNVLCLLEQRTDGTWRIAGRNHLALPQSDHVPYLYCEIPGQMEVYLSGDDPGCLFFEESADGWVVSTVEREKTGLYAYVKENCICYYTPDEETGMLTKAQEVHGVFSRDFEQFWWTDFPQTPAEASKRLSYAPILPSVANEPYALSAMNISFRPGEKYDVFSAPGRDSYRAAQGKAVMSTNDWVQVFGQEDGWLLVQYDVSSNQMRFGYIDISALKAGTVVPTLQWENTPLRTTRAVTLTDDPLGEETPLLALKADTEVTLLATLGTWRYVEVTRSNHQTARGFLPASAVEVIDIDKLNPNG